MPKRILVPLVLIGLFIVLALISPVLHPSRTRHREIAEQPGALVSVDQDINERSCATVSLPWEADQEFMETQNSQQTPVLLAGYRARLIDPLPGEAFNIGRAAEFLRGVVVQPGQVFSQNQQVGPYNRQRGFQEGPTYSGNHITTTVGGGVCKIASLLYNVVTLANLKIVERHPHSLTVPYVPPGQDATVYYGVKDFRFCNNTEAPLLIWAEFRDDTLYMALYGRTPPPEVVWSHEVLGQKPTWTEYRYNPSLSPGEERVIMPGQEGITVRSRLTITYADGHVETRKLGVDSYSASPRIVERLKPI